MANPGLGYDMDEEWLAAARDSTRRGDSKSQSMINSGIEFNDDQLAVRRVDNESGYE